MTDGAVTEHDARRAVADAVPDERVVSVSHVEAGTNAVYRVETREDAYVVKFNTFSGFEIFAAETEVYRLLADIDLPVPRVVDAGLDRSEGPAYVVVDALPGDTPEAVTPALAREMGEMLREFASIPPVDGYGRLQRAADRSPPLVTLHDTWRESVQWYADVLLSKPADALADVAPDVRTAIDETLAAVPREPDPAVVVHDFRPQNVHVDSDGAIVGVFDLERAAVGDLRQALVNTAYLLTRHPSSGESGQSLEALYEGFGTDVDGDVRDCYRAIAVAREIRGFDLWWDEDVAEEKAADVRTVADDLTK